MIVGCQGQHWIAERLAKPRGHVTKLAGESAFNILTGSVGVCFAKRLHASCEQSECSRFFRGKTIHIFVNIYIYRCIYIYIYFILYYNTIYVYMYIYIYHIYFY